MRSSALSYVVISSFENVESGDLQAQGEAVAVFATEPLARAHFDARAKALETAANSARDSDTAASFITWTVMLCMPLDVAGIEEALEDLEMVIEETESDDDPFGELVVAYAGRRHGPAGVVEYLQKDALQALEDWLS
jgi:hypothetical protein